MVVTCWTVSIQWVVSCSSPLPTGGEGSTLTRLLMTGEDPPTMACSTCVVHVRCTAEVAWWSVCLSVCLFVCLSVCAGLIL